MKCARCRTFTESTCSTPVRVSVRVSVRIVGGECGGSRKPCAARAIRRACACDNVDVEPALVGECTDANLVGGGDRLSPRDRPLAGLTGPGVMIRVVLEDDFLPLERFLLARPPSKPENPGVLSHRGRRLAARVSATAAALALAGTAIVLNGQARTGAALEAAADSVARAGSPTSGSLTIANLSFTPNNLTIAKGGTLTVTNNSTFVHSITSDAIASDGKPLFDVLLPIGAQNVSVPISTLGGGTYTFHCK